MSIRVARMLAALAILRLRGLPVVWTVHNIAPHEPRSPWVERLAMRLVARLATTLHVHSRWAGERVVSELRIRDKGKVVVAPHGNYIRTYGPARSRAASRDELGMPGAANVYLMFGAIRAYKRIPAAIRDFRGLEDRNAVLVVAGRAVNESLRDEVEEAAAGDSRVVLRLGFVAEEEVGTLFGAADAAILNYEEVFSSGALMAALSTGTPVVAPAGGTTEEIASSPAFEPFTDGNLVSALSRVVEGDRRLRHEAALCAAESCDWEMMAKLLAEALGEDARSRQRRRTGRFRSRVHRS